MNVRAKIRCNSELTSRWTPGGPTQRAYEFSAVYDTSIPEDQRYAAATPSASLKIVVDNAAVAFEPGSNYYIDFTKAE
jgi:hypothetical protein